MTRSARRQKRRFVNAEWQKQFQEIRERTAKYGDEMLRIDTIEMYDGPDTPVADMIVVCNVLEYVPDPDKVLQDVNLKARKQVLLTIRPDALRSAEAWREIVERRLTVCDWFLDQGNIVCTCSPGMKVQGVKVTGALSDDERWGHVLASIKRFGARIEPGAAQQRRVIICGYGPSIRSHWHKLKEERDQDNAIVVSVSGSHDFLLDRGIVSDFHVECDPRPHKTQNLNKPSQAVRYLIASSCHPSYFDRLNGCDVRLWHVAVSEHIMRLIDDMGEKREHIVSGGGSVGLRSISLMFALGYRNFSMYGMDCSFETADGRSSFSANEQTPLDIVQWAGPHAGKAQQLCLAQCGGEIFISSPVLVTYAGGFFDIMKRLPDTKFRVYGDGLLPAMCRLYSSNESLEAA